MSKYLILLSSLIFAVAVYGQPENPNTPDPTVTSYSKYADIEPNLYNGATSVPIPIATVSSGPLSMPVSLSYHTAGIRAHELSSSVGLGWSLFAGGAITRRVRGLPDESEHGYLNTGDYADAYGMNEVTYDAPYRDEVIAGTKDGEADLFNFNVGGLSGQFVFDSDGNVHTIQESNLEITSTELINDDVINFKIVGTDGTQYFFGPSTVTDADEYRDEITYYDQSLNLLDSYFTTWHLRRIITHDGLHYIDFSYTADVYSYYSLQDCSYYGTQTSCEMQAYRVVMDGYLPSTITSSSNTSTIHFDYNSNRQDLIGNAKRLYRIREVEGGSTVNYNLYQSYFEDTHSNAIPSHLSIQSSHEDEVKKRLKLDSLTITGGSSSMPAYTFLYYDQSVAQINGNYFPSQVTQAIDHWGYYNKETDNNDEDHIIPETTITWNPGNGTATGGLASIDRDVDINGSIAGSLSRITYPLGGYTQFSYESNEYFYLIPSKIIPT